MGVAMGELGRVRGGGVCWWVVGLAGKGDEGFSNRCQQAWSSEDRRRVYPARVILIIPSIIISFAIITTN